MSIRKQYLLSQPICKVTFKIARHQLGGSAKQVFLLGEFNQWSGKAHPMNRLNNGTYSLTIDLEKGKEYQFRYQIHRLDRKLDWYNDIDADGFATTPFGDSVNSVISL